MKTWREVWHNGIAPLLSTAALQLLAKALRDDDPRLIQGATTKPPPLQAVQDWPTEAACVVGFCGWEGDHLNTVAEVEEYFARTCAAADDRLEEPAGSRHFLDWFDETPRDEMRRELLPEVERALEARQANGTAHSL